MGFAFQINRSLMIWQHSDITRSSEDVGRRQRSEGRCFGEGFSPGILMFSRPFKCVLPLVFDTRFGPSIRLARKDPRNGQGSRTFAHTI